MTHLPDKEYRIAQMFFVVGILAAILSAFNEMTFRIFVVLDLTTVVLLIYGSKRI